MRRKLCGTVFFTEKNRGYAAFFGRRDSLAQFAYERDDVPGNYREMWCFNLASSALYAVMWLAEFFSNGTGLSFAVMQIAVSLINVKGIVHWKRSKKTTDGGESRGEKDYSRFPLG